MYFRKRIFEVLSQEGVRGLFRKLRRKIALGIEPTLDPFPQSPEPPCVVAELDAIVVELRRLLMDDGEMPDTEITALLSDLAPWYQRVRLPNGGTTYSNPEWIVDDDQGTDSLLGGRLTPREAGFLRPLPKWRFIRPRLPDIEGRTVLEVGSSCGFFSFEFAKMGASEVTGIDFNPKNIIRASTLRDILGYKNVQFLQHDWDHDSLSGKYDIVFSSSVITHVLFPFSGIYKLLKLAQRYLILDEFVTWPKQSACFYNYSTSSHFSHHHSFAMSDKLMMEFFDRCGVGSDAVVKHPYLKDRCLYVIDISKASVRPISP